VSLTKTKKLLLIKQPRPRERLLHQPKVKVWLKKSNRHLKKLLHKKKLRLMKRRKKLAYKPNGINLTLKLSSLKRTRILLKSLVSLSKTK